MTYLALTVSLLNVALVQLVNKDNEADDDDDDDDDDTSVWLSFSSVEIRRSTSTHLAS